MRPNGPFDQLNAEKEILSRYRFQIEEALNGSQSDLDYLAEDFEEILPDITERELSSVGSFVVKLYKADE